MGVAAAILAILWPKITALVLVFLVAAWAIVTGVLTLGAACLIRRIVRNEWLLVVGGIVSILFGVLRVINPRAGLVTIGWLFGAYMFIFGVLSLAPALRLRSMHATLVVGTFE